MHSVHATRHHATTIPRGWIVVSLAAGSWFGLFAIWQAATMVFRSIIG